MIVIGIDPGIATTGYGLVEETNNGFRVIDYGAILTTPEALLGERLQVIYTKLHALILLHKPESGAVEKLFYQKNVTSAVNVGQARGVAMLALADCRIQIAEYSPKEVKQSITGYGGAQKAQIQQMVKALLGLSEIPKPDDAADALSIAICHLNSYKLQNLIHSS